jgi:hypothetical protein
MAREAALRAGGAHGEVAPGDDAGRCDSPAVVRLLGSAIDWTDDRELSARDRAIPQLAPLRARHPPFSPRSNWRDRGKLELAQNEAFAPLHDAQAVMSDALPDPVVRRSRPRCSPPTEPMSRWMRSARRSVAEDDTCSSADAAGGGLCRARHRPGRARRALAFPDRAGPCLVAAARNRTASPLSRAAIETLAIIAYHEPVSRAEIEAIRGVQVSEGHHRRADGGRAGSRLPAAVKCLDAR